MLDPKERLGSLDTDGYSSIRSHEFFSGMSWKELHKQTPPPMLPHVAGAGPKEGLQPDYQIPSHLEPGRKLYWLKFMVHP